MSATPPGFPARRRRRGSGAARRGSAVCAGRRRRTPRDSLRIPGCRSTRDGKITLVVGHSEMGQGVRTSLAMILAEELEADWASIAIRQASPGPGYTDLGTGGSGSIEDSWTPLRAAGAAAREMLVAAAAKRWGVPASACRAANATVRHADSGRKLGTERSSLRRRRCRSRRSRVSRTRKDFRLVGKGIARIDGPAIVSGRAVYGLDVRVPGMLFAAVARCPVAGR